MTTNNCRSEASGSYRLTYLSSKNTTTMLCSKIIRGEFDVNDASEVPTLAPDLIGFV